MKHLVTKSNMAGRKSRKRGQKITLHQSMDPETVKRIVDTSTGLKKDKVEETRVEKCSQLYENQYDFL